MIHWNPRLYMDEKVQKNPVRYRKIFEKKGLRGCYCIALPVNRQNSLEIYSSRTFWFRYQRQRGMQIVGLASSYANAVELVERIVQDVHMASGEINAGKIHQYFET